MSKKTYRVTIEAEFKDQTCKIHFRIRGRNQKEAIQNAEIAITQAYGDEVLAGEILDCQLIA